MIIRHILVLFFMVYMLTEFASGKCFLPIHEKILKLKPSISIQYACVLSNEIKIISSKYGICPHLYAAIIMQESGYRLSSVNTKSGDYGLTQINVVNIAYYKLSKRRLMSDLTYSLESGAVILTWFKKRFGHENDWFCRYNAGTGKDKATMKRCNEYATLVKRWI